MSPSLCLQTSWKGIYTYWLIAHSLDAENLAYSFTTLLHSMVINYSDLFFFFFLLNAPLHWVPLTTPYKLAVCSRCTVCSSTAFRSSQVFGIYCVQGTIQVLWSLQGWINYRFYPQITDSSEAGTSTPVNTQLKGVIRQTVNICGSSQEDHFKPSDGKSSNEGN